MDKVNNETIIDNILKDARVEALNLAKYYGFGKVDLQINIHKSEISEIYNLKTDRNKSVRLKIRETIIEN